MVAVEPQLDPFAGVLAAAARETGSLVVAGLRAGRGRAAGRGSRGEGRDGPGRSGPRAPAGGPRGGRGLGPTPCGARGR